MGALTAGVVGGTGHTGGELCRLLLGHPEIDTILPTARDSVSFGAVHPNLLGAGCEFIPGDQLAARADELDVVFFCTPSGEAMRQAAHYLERGVRVIDLSADFRFADPAAYQRVYGREHTEPELLASAVYGVTELARDEVAKASLVANPGCYAITAILGLAPLLRADLLDTTLPISIHAVNGTTGAGNTPKKSVMHAQMAGSMLAYSLDGHRHGPELETYLPELSGSEVVVDFNTAHGNFARGIHLQANVRLTQECGRDELLELYTEAYGTGHEKEYFVLVNTLPKNGVLNDKQYEVYPSLGNVVGSNFCQLGIDRDDDRGIVKIVAVTDNLIKGAAGSAIQNMNVMFGLDEPLGLRAYAL